MPVNGLRAGWGEGRGRVLKYPVKRILQASDDEHFIFCSSFFFLGFPFA